MVTKLCKFIGLACFFLMAGYIFIHYIIPFFLMSFSVAIPSPKLVDTSKDLPLIVAEGKVFSTSYRHNREDYFGFDLCVLKNGEIAKLTKGVYRPSISNDAMRVLIYDFSNKKGFRIQNLTTGKILNNIPLSLENPDDRVDSYDWYPDEKKIAIAISRSIPGQGQIWNLYVFDIDSKQLSKITNFTIPRTHGLQNPRWAPDGSRILFSYSKCADIGRETGKGIFIINPDGTGLKELLGNEVSWGKDATWSNYGRYIVFISNITNDRFYEQVYLIRKDGTDKKVITNILMPKNTPVFSPDDKQICFAGYPRGLEMHCGSQLFVVNTDGAGLGKLTEPIRLKNGDLSRDEYPIWRK